jgi:hypothetical protein
VPASKPRQLACPILAAGRALAERLQFPEFPILHAAGSSGIKNVLLIQGAWADGSTWNDSITTLLEATMAKRMP